MLTDYGVVYGCCHCRTTYMIQTLPKRRMDSIKRESAKPEWLIETVASYMRNASVNASIAFDDCDDHAMMRMKPIMSNLANTFYRSSNVLTKW